MLYRALRCLYLLASIGLSVAAILPTSQRTTTTKLKVALFDHQPIQFDVMSSPRSSTHMKALVYRSTRAHASASFHTQSTTDSDPTYQPVQLSTHLNRCHVKSIFPHSIVTPACWFVAANPPTRPPRAMIKANLFHRQRIPIRALDSPCFHTLTSLEDIR